MELKITRLASDERCYLIESEDGRISGLEASGLKQWLLDVGMGDSMIATVLDMSPNETMLFTVGRKAA